MDKRPRCKHCGGQHRQDQPHARAESTNVTPRGFGTGTGRPREHPTNASRQRAYRERKGSAIETASTDGAHTATL